MRNRFLYSTILACLLLPNVGVWAQSSSENRKIWDYERGKPPAQTSSIVMEEKIHDGKMLVMMTPQFLLIDQLRIEIDRKIKHRHWISFAPHYVQDHKPFQTHRGLGLGATYKWFVGMESPVYIGGGLQFTRHTLENSGFDDVSKMDMWLYNTNITQYGINAVAGRYIRFFPHIFGDIYAGVGYRFSTTNTTDGKPHEFHNRFFNLAQTGFTIVVGVRFGILL